MDPHLRSLATAETGARNPISQHIVSQGRASKSTIESWQSHLVSQHMAECHLQARHLVVLCSAFDATRLGRPSLEAFLHCVTFGGRAAILPPVAPVLDCSALLAMHTHDQ